MGCSAMWGGGGVVRWRGVGVRWGGRGAESLSKDWGRLGEGRVCYKCWLGGCWWVWMVHRTYGKYTSHRNEVFKTSSWHIRETTRFTKADTIICTLRYG